MITCIGIKLYNLSFFHLIFHAYFKALLFLTVGSILHTILDIQDMRFTGGLYNLLPISYIFLLYGLTSLIGLPFTTGYYSKENIIMMSYNYSNNNNLDLLLSEYIFIITLLTAFITILYSYKFIYNIFYNTTKLSLFIFKNLHFYSLHLTFSISILSFITLIIGYLFNK
jgi:NADH:ubiquinone oxidoreductase subunit 5 (subunit L)/multisubunit Na+/H+ antiporter MnhA subunit